MIVLVKGCGSSKENEEIQQLVDNCAGSTVSKLLSQLKGTGAEISCYKTETLIPT